MALRMASSSGKALPRTWTLSMQPGRSLPCLETLGGILFFLPIIQILFLGPTQYAVQYSVGLEHRGSEISASADAIISTMDFCSMSRLVPSDDSIGVPVTREGIPNLVVDPPETTTVRDWTHLSGTSIPPFMTLMCRWMV